MSFHITYVSNDNLNVGLTESNIQLPTEKQSTFTNTIQTHPGITVATNGNSTNSDWIDADGFSELAVTVLSDNNTAQFAATILWSNDKTNIHGAETVLGSAVAVWANARSGQVTTKARYFKLVLINSDSSNPHVMSAWAYLKA
ncbi:hypothetical protein COJ01_17020 [Priestia megaterium]|uniref:hypothetical protein n=1 Tax=Priestia megaterium TaxID=1404 RepID=UPI000BF56DE3|nr:hypothetical protein [Priestia megaterium]PFK99773.1 hypothetical protein COJ01_17020 [Priestia megaterium]